MYAEIKEDGEIISSCMTDHNGPIENVFEPCLLGKVSGDTVVSPEVIYHYIMRKIIASYWVKEDIVVKTP